MQFEWDGDTLWSVPDGRLLGSVRQSERTEFWIIDPGTWPIVSYNYRSSDHAKMALEDKFKAKPHLGHIDVITSDKPRKMSLFDYFADRIWKAR